MLSGSLKVQPAHVTAWVFITEGLADDLGLPGVVMNKIDYMKPLSQQLDTVLPQLVEHDVVIDKVLPFYLAVTAKLSGKTTKEVFGYNAQALEAIFGSENAGKNPRELAESEYAYRVHAIAREMFDKLPEIKAE